MEELLQYREIGTVEECREAVRATERQLPSKQLEDFLAFAKECKETYQISYSCVGDEDKRLQDLLHALEFTDNKYDMHVEALKLWSS